MLILKHVRKTQRGKISAGSSRRRHRKKITISFISSIVQLHDTNPFTENTCNNPQRPPCLIKAAQHKLTHFTLMLLTLNLFVHFMLFVSVLQPAGFSKRVWNLFTLLSFNSLKKKLSQRTNKKCDFAGINANCREAQVKGWRFGSEAFGLFQFYLVA